MAEIREPVKLVPLVGTIEPFVPTGDEPRFTGAVAIWGVGAAALALIPLLLFVATKLK